MKKIENLQLPKNCKELKEEEMQKVNGGAKNLVQCIHEWLRKLY